jgi:uncharacterized protein
MIRSLRLVAIALALSVSACTPFEATADTADGAQLDRVFRRSTLQIATPDARLHTFKIWIADDNERRARGLMFVKELAQDEGMLFVYEQPQPIGMWMKNTFISLDMLFVAADGRVLNVAEKTEPHSLKTIESKGDAIGVIELKAGTAAKLHIAKGARVMHAAFKTQ